MTLSYNQDEMLALWRRRRGLEPLRSDGITVRRDGLDVDTLMLAELNAWYANLLARGSLDMVEVTELTDKIVRKLDGTTLSVTLPERCRRVVSVRGRGWSRSAIPTPLEQVNVLDINQYAGRGPENPLAILDDRILTLYRVTGSEIESLRVVVQPEGGIYRFDETALATIPTLYS